MQLLTIFPMLQYDFMRHAFLAAVLIAPLFALLGTMAVNNKMAFFSDALGHSAFTGIGLGVLLGMQEPLLAMLAFGIFLGLVITKVKSANMVSSDTVISVFSSAAMALGIVILSASGGFAKYSSYLIGDILTVGRKDLWTIGIVLVAAYECEPLSGGKPRCARDAGGKYICDNGCGCGYGFHPLGGDTDD